MSSTSSKDRSLVFEAKYTYCCQLVLPTILTIEDSYREWREEYIGLRRPPQAAHALWIWENMWVSIAELMFYSTSLEGREAGQKGRKKGTFYTEKEAEWRGLSTGYTGISSVKVGLQKQAFTWLRKISFVTSFLFYLPSFRGIRIKHELCNAYSHFLPTSQCVENTEHFLPDVITRHCGGGLAE